jgi:hypothetical protein
MWQCMYTYIPHTGVFLLAFAMCNMLGVLITAYYLKKQNRCVCVCVDECPRLSISMYIHIYMCMYVFVYAYDVYTSFL